MIHHRFVYLLSIIRIPKKLREHAQLKQFQHIKLINNIVKEGYIPDDWRKSILVPVYKGKGDPLVCGSYRAIKLLEQPMKVLERVLEKRIICRMSIDNMQFGFMPGKGTTDAIFIMRQVKRNTKQRRRSCTMLLWI